MLIRSYVGVMCEDCQMMRKTASVPHGSTGRAGPLLTLHDPAMMMMMTMMSDTVRHGRPHPAALLCSALEYPRVATCTSCNHLIRRHTHHTHTYSQHLPNLPTYITYTLNPTKQEKRREEFKVTTHQQQQVRTRYSRARLHYLPVPTTAQSINPRCP